MAKKKKEINEINACRLQSIMYDTDGRNSTET